MSPEGAEVNQPCCRCCGVIQSGINVNVRGTHSRCSSSATDPRWKGFACNVSNECDAHRAARAPWLFDPLGVVAVQVKLSRNVARGFCSCRTTTAFKLPRVCLSFFRIITVCTCVCVRVSLLGFIVVSRVIKWQISFLFSCSYRLDSCLVCNSFLLGLLLRFISFMQNFNVILEYYHRCCIL